MVKTKKGVKKYARKHLGAELKLRKKLKPMKQALRRQAASFRAKAADDGQQELDVGDQKEKPPAKASPASRLSAKKGVSEASQHKRELDELAEKDPEFFEFLKEHDKELLDFSDEEPEEEESEDEKMLDLGEGEENGGDALSKDFEEERDLTLTTAIVDDWCASVKQKVTHKTVRNLLQAFRSACHYGDNEDAERKTKYNLANSHVFNKIMVFALLEMDEILRSMICHGDSGNKSEPGKLPKDLRKSSGWKKIEPLVKSYLGNVLHILNQMTDNDMISFTLRRLRASVPFLTVFPKLAARFLKAALHFWGSGEGALPVIALFLVREMAVKLEAETLDACLKGMYKEYAANCRFVNPASLPQIKFRMNCVAELYGIDFNASYQFAFIYIRQMAFILRNAMTVKTKDAYKRVYSWQFMNSLHLWVKVLSTHASQGELRPLVYPLVQVIGGVARLVPTARYFPLRLQCVRMLNQLGEAMSVFVPVSPLLLDMLQFKELHMPPTGGSGKPVDFNTVLKVPKADIKTRAFQDECVSSVVEELGEHLALWSYAIAFPELSVVPLLHLRHFLKSTTVERFRRQVKLLVEQIEMWFFVGKKRDAVTFSPKDSTSVKTFLQAEREAGASPLSKYLGSLRQRAEQRRSNIYKSSEVVGDIKKAGKKRTDVGNEMGYEDDKETGADGGDDAEKAAQVFRGDWIAEKKKKVESKKTPSAVSNAEAVKAGSGEDEDVVEDLMLSSDDDVEEPEEDVSDFGSESDGEEENGGAKPSSRKAPIKKRRSLGPKGLEKSDKLFKKQKSKKVKGKRPGRSRELT